MVVEFSHPNYVDRMARTRAADFDEKREAIMKMAANLFAEKGFNGASISDLSNGCGVSKSLIYHYYSSKEDILYDVMNSHIDELIFVVNNTDSTSKSAKTRFTNLTKAILECYTGAQDEQKVLLYELNKLKPAQRKEIVSKQREIIKRFEELYLEISPSLKSNLPLLKSKIMLFFGMINWTHTWFNPNGAINRNQLAEIAAQTLTD